MQQTGLRSSASWGHLPAQRASTADQKWHFHFPQCPVHSTTISQLQTYRSETDTDYKSQFPTVQLSMPPDWRRRRERETSYMLGLTAVFAPYPLGGGACGARRPPRVGWGCGSTRGPAKGVAWGGAGREGERATGHRAHCLISSCPQSFPAPAEPPEFAAAFSTSAFMPMSTISS